MINLFTTNIKNQHDIFLLNKDNGKWLNRTLTGLYSPPSVSIVRNSGMGIKKNSNKRIV